MELYIDNSKIGTDGLLNETLENVLRRTQTELCTPGKLVVALRCNGEEIPAGEMAGTLKKPLSSFDRLEVVTSSTDELVVEAMDQAAVSLTQTEEACQRIADSLAEGKAAESMEALSACLSVWQQIHEAISKSVVMLELDPELTLIDGEPLVQLVTKPMSILLRVKEALQSQDHVLLADTLKYEFSEVAQQWQRVIAYLQEKAQTAPQNADVP